ncbi:hypothetical protein FSARC_1703 [Fusarium sarcochroum]|uniref:Zn(2)-C6 fungal-type domain-containing protein n=1 Tax=Fusarium sarcochroum TaxID=1208366 RepID=A0A8H4U804_9HYPO|nr:hypothetical protein FSARC_1703 [Fusarium sarcochroum]
MEVASEATQNSPVPVQTDPCPKRRKIRKGTRSCWECKRRKIRCSFTDPAGPVCIPCQRRGNTCASQEYPEETAPSARGRHMGDRIVRVEALVEQLTKKVATDSHVSTTPSTATDNGCPGTRASTPGLIDGAAVSPSLSANPAFAATTIPTNRHTRYEEISEALHTALPPRRDIDLMVKAGIDVSWHKLITHPYAVLTQIPGAGAGHLHQIPDTKDHPVLLARYLLILATCLLNIHPELHAKEIGCLSEPPRQMMRRLADTAVELVTKNDDFLGSVEGLECVMLEATFEAGCGNLRRAWFATRRAMVTAQMMGLHRSGTLHRLEIIDPGKPIYPGYFWYRIVCTDRQLSLMLGLPQGSLDTSMASEAALVGDTPSGRFERKQSIIACRILERNESVDATIIDDLDALQSLDSDLQRAANEMPSKWWLVPNLASMLHDPEKSFWEAMRLIEQMLYYNLLHHVHLPYMLRSSTLDAEANYKYDYSKLTSVNASREILTRFIMFRSSNRVAFCCRSIDFFALTAAMTLAIAHLDSHGKQRQGKSAGINVLAHHRNGDRAMMEQVLEKMQDVARLSSDALSERSSSLLRSLLALEEDAAAGTNNGSNCDDHGLINNKTIREMHTDSAIDDGRYLRLEIPYFGTIKIGSEGVVSMGAHPCPSSPPLANGGHTSSNTIRSSQQGHVDTEAGCRVEDRTTSFDEPTSSIDQELRDVPLTGLDLPFSQQFAPQFPTTIDDALQQQYLYPGLTAGADDWAFQGVDMAFFDTLTKSSRLEGTGDESQWTN